MDRTLGYDPKDASSSLAVPAKLVCSVRVAHLTLTQIAQVLTLGVWMLIKNISIQILTDHLNKCPVGEMVNLPAGRQAHLI